MKINCRHLRDYNISWIDHHKRAVKWAWTMQKATICLTIHSILPWAFESYASARVHEISKEMRVQ